MRKVELEIVALSHTITHSQSYAVVLGEKDGSRRLPIVIGAFEAQAIAVAMERMNPARPLTHDLMKNLCLEFDIELKEVIINKLMDAIFYARLVCQKNGKLLEIDSRTSDALALAVRFGCPIYTYEAILEQAGIILEEPNEKGRSKEKVASSTSTGTNDYSHHNLDTLNTMLGEAINKEDYEKAAKIRDAINQKTQQSS